MTYVEVGLTPVVVRATVAGMAKKLVLRFEGWCFHCGRVMPVGTAAWLRVIEGRRRYHHAVKAECGPWVPPELVRQRAYREWLATSGDGGASAASEGDGDARGEAP